MLNPDFIRTKSDEVKGALRNRGMNDSLVDEFLLLDESWRTKTKILDDARALLKNLSKERNIEKAKGVKSDMKNIEGDVATLAKDRDALLVRFPNVPDKDVPICSDASGNVVVKTKGKKPTGELKDYLSISESLDLIDIPRAAKVSGTRFGYLKREAARLEFAIANFTFDAAAKAGFIPVVPPAMIRPEMMIGMGKHSFLKEKDAFYLAEDDLYLIGSAEHAIGPMHAGEVFTEEELPKRYIGFSSAFRREAGSYGKDTKGILRVKQFDKLELFSFTKPEESDAEHKFLLDFQESLMQQLKLPYQVVQICTADMTFADKKQFDIETWMPGENNYRETHSCSNTGDFQSRGLHIKYADATGKKEFVHTLNATGFAIGRTLIAIIENYQTKDGGVTIPRALSKYTGFKKIKAR